MIRFPGRVVVLAAAVLVGRVSVAQAQLLPQAAAFARVAAGHSAQGGGERTLPPRVGITQDASISLIDAIAQALMNNPDVAMARIAVDQATRGVGAANGAFDTQFGLQTSFQRQQVPVSSLIGGAASGKLTQDGLVFGPDFRGVLRDTGTRYELAFTSRRQTTDNQFVTLNPQFPTELSVTVTQPLFRGRRIDEPRRQLEVAKQNASLTDAQLRQRVMDLALQTEAAYWELRFAEENLRVQLQGRDLARDQVASNQRLVNQGVAAPIDVLEAETQVATFSQRIFGAQAALTRAENALKTLILPDRSSALWASALHTATSAPPDAAVLSLDEAVRLATTNRPELSQAAIATATQAAETRFFGDQRRPQVDLVGTYSSAGLAGRVIQGGANPFSFGTEQLIERINVLSGVQGLAPLPSFPAGGGGSTIPPVLTGGFGQSLSNLGGLDFSTVEVGVRIGLPLGNRTADARYATAVAEQRRLELRTTQIEIAIEASVRNAMQAVESARAGLDAAVQARSLAEQQYASEQRRFEAGTSTVFLVLQRQTAMIATRTQHARAEADLNRSLAELHHATGQILAAHQITVR
jgi:HAE1 family hydrophobic/amphiphilic exporter-1